MTNLDENASRGGGGERLAVSARVDAKDLRKNAGAGRKAWGGRKASGGMLGPWHLGRRRMDCALGAWAVDAPTSAGIMTCMGEINIPT